MKPYAKAQTFVLGEKLDRRHKITDEDIRRIREIYAKGGIGHRALARMFHISKSYVGILVNPERARKVKENQKANWKQYHERKGKEEHAKAVRKTRNYKYGLYKKGVIGNEKEKEDASEEN